MSKRRQVPSSEPVPAIQVEVAAATQDMRCAARGGKLRSDRLRNRRLASKYNHAPNALPPGNMATVLMSESWPLNVCTHLERAQSLRQASEKCIPATCPFPGATLTRARARTRTRTRTRTHRRCLRSRPNVPEFCFGIACTRHERSSVRAYTQKHHISCVACKQMRVGG